MTHFLQELYENLLVPVKNRKTKRRPRWPLYKSPNVTDVPLYLLISLLFRLEFVYNGYPSVQERKELSTMQVQEAIQKRLSIRRYADAAISDEHLDILFKALQLAASGNNYQNWEFVFVKNPDVKQRLVPACNNQSFVRDCAYFIAGVADPTMKWHMVDITIALTQFALQAVELGYGTCWIGAFDEAGVKQVLNVPDDKKVVICMTLGLPTGKHVPRGRKTLEKIIYMDKFGARFKSSDE